MIPKNDRRQFITVEDLGLPPLPEITSLPSEWHPLNGPPEMVEWCAAAIKLGAFAGSAIRGYSELPDEEDA